MGLLQEVHGNCVEEPCGGAGMGDWQWENNASELYHNIEVLVYVCMVVQGHFHVWPDICCKLIELETTTIIWLDN